MQPRLKATVLAFSTQGVNFLMIVKLQQDMCVYKIREPGVPLEPFLLGDSLQFSWIITV